MRRCIICGEESNLQSATDTSYICKTCFEHLRFCASFDRLMCDCEMPADDEVALEPCVIETRATHAVAVPGV